MKYSSTPYNLDDLKLPAKLDGAYSYWRDLRGERPAPSWRDVDMMALPLDLVPWCSVMDVHGGGEDFSVRFFGTERVRLHGSDYSSKMVSAMNAPPGFLDKVRTEMRQVIAEGRPLLFKTVLSKGRSPDEDPESYRVLRLPFADNADQGVNVILSMLEHPVVPKALYDWFETEPPLNMGYESSRR